jgi:integrase
MKEAWGKISDRNMEQIEIIDIRDRDDLAETWSPFIHTHHYETHKSFFDSHLANVPRRLIPHSLRHTHTSLLAVAGGALEQIMDRLGHSDD